MRTLSSMVMPASNATVSTLYGNRCGVSGGLNQEALSRDCSMLTDIKRVATGLLDKARDPSRVWEPVRLFTGFALL